MLTAADSGTPPPARRTPTPAPGTSSSCPAAMSPTTTPLASTGTSSCCRQTLTPARTTACTGWSPLHQLRLPLLGPGAPPAAATAAAAAAPRAAPPGTGVCAGTGSVSRSAPRMRAEGAGPATGSCAHVKVPNAHLCLADCLHPGASWMVRRECTSMCDFVGADPVGAGPVGAGPVSSIACGWKAEAHDAHSMGFINKHWFALKRWLHCTLQPSSGE